MTASVQESLDVAEPVSDTSHWDIQDKVLESVIDKDKHMLAGEPFLHESLIVERDEVLSEQEKLEARVMYEREKNAEVRFSFTIHFLHSEPAILWWNQRFCGNCPETIFESPTVATTAVQPTTTTTAYSFEDWTYALSDAFPRQQYHVEWSNVQ